MLSLLVGGMWLIKCIVGLLGDCVVMCDDVLIFNGWFLVYVGRCIWGEIVVLGWVVDVVCVIEEFGGWFYVV